MTASKDGDGDGDGGVDESQRQQPHQPLVSQSELLELLESTLPQERVAYAFGYGSGVLSQQRQEPKKAVPPPVVAATTTRAQQEQQQQNNDSADERNVVDMIVAVDDSYEFHLANARRNPNHYRVPTTTLLSSSLFGGGGGGEKDRAAIVAAERATWWQRHEMDAAFPLRHRNPKVYFVVTPRLKYGVVQVEDLVRDLTDWNCLYLAGRMHKPTVEIVDRQQQPQRPDEKGNVAANNIRLHQETRNLPAALSAALLLQSVRPLPHNTPLEDERHQMDETTMTAAVDAANTATACCTSSELYARIAGLSYGGDFRTAIGAEDPDKVRNLVRGAGQLERFDRLYDRAARNLVHEGILSVDGQSGANEKSCSSNSSSHHGKERRWSWDIGNLNAQRYLWSTLPAPVRQMVAREITGTNPRGDADDVVETIVSSSYSVVETAQALQRVLQTRIVAPAARYQSLKGLATAGFAQSAKYALRKLSKGPMGKLLFRRIRKK